MRAAAIQLTATHDRDRNLETADRLVRAAVRDGARLVVLPEKWSHFSFAKVVHADADLDRLAGIRRDLPSPSSRRPDVYERVG